MFKWLGRKRAIQSLNDGPVGTMIGQMALAVAVAESASEYHQSQAIRPIIRDEKAGVVEVWSGTRLEAISKLWGFGAANLDLLIDPTKHPALLERFIVESSSFLSFSPPCGDEIKDTLSAMLRVYDYIAELENEVGVPHRQIIKENPTYVSIYGSLVVDMRSLLLRWRGFRYALDSKIALPEQPKTIFEIIWKDVTHRSKLIALCGKLGPYYMATVLTLRDRIQEAGQSSDEFDDLIVKVLSVDDPDQLRKNIR
jgi:hypothetical protein